jgi:hypothetical protein
MPTRPLNIQAIVLVLNAAFNILLALWILDDARRRRADKPLFAALAMLLLGPLWLAYYLTDRPVCADEHRRGGFGWTWTRNFAWAWTGAMTPWLAVFFVGPAVPAWLQSVPTLLGMWLVPIALATAIGYVVRRPDINESGGPAPARARFPIAAIFALAALVALIALKAWITIATSTR